jgi:LacI family transcriptional regulator
MCEVARVYKITLIIDLSGTPGRNLMRGIARYARLYGPWQLNHFWGDFYESSPKKADFLANLKKNLRNSDGVIMREPYAVDFIKDLEIPAIIASAIRDAEVPTKPTILTNSRTIGKMGADYFIQKGFKNLAFCGLKKMLWSEHRQNYFEDTSRKAGLEIFKYSFTYPHRESSRDAKLNLIARWIRRLPKPVGIMSCNDLCGKFIVDSCRGNSIAVPQEVAVLGVDNDDILCDLTYPPLSSIELNTERGGFEAAALLDKIIKGVEVDTKTIVIEPVGVQERQSTDIVAFDDKIVSDVLSFIKNNAQRPLQVVDILNEFNISRRSLYTKFNNSVGTGVYEQIRKIRVEKICKMLVETNKSVKEIAFEFGFHSVDHIARFFRKEKGITPTQYRSKSR